MENGKADTFSEELDPEMRNLSKYAESNPAGITTESVGAVLL